MKPVPTMADVARLAGVSAMTVSRALRRDGSVSVRTRERVLQVIEEVGYVPDQAAGALSSGRSGLVAAILPTLVQPLFPQVAQGLSDTLFNAGYQLFLGASEYSADREEEILRAVLSRRPEAVMLAGVGHTGKAARMLAGARIPVVEFFDGADPPIDHLVEIDPVALGRETVAYLARKGRNRIAVVTGRTDDRRGAARLKGLVAAASAAGLPEPVSLQFGSPAQPLEQGARAAAAIVDDGLDVDAVVLMTDIGAIGAMTALRERGRRTPEDIAVFGFGDCDVARHVTPSLTTIGFNAVGAGVEIGKIMLSALEADRDGRSCLPYRLALEFQIVERASA